MARALLVAAIAVVVAVFAMQNATPVAVRFLAWRVEQASLAAVILLSVCTGIVMVGVPLWVQLRWERGRRRRTEGGPQGPGTGAPRPGGPAPRPGPPPASP